MVSGSPAAAAARDLDFSQIGWFSEDDDLLTEVGDIVAAEKKRLEKCAEVCDTLKQVSGLPFPDNS